MGRPRTGRVVAVHPHADLYGSDRMFLESLGPLGPDVLAVLSTSGPLVEAVRARGVEVLVKDFPVLRKVELRDPRKAVVFLRRFLSSVGTLAAWLREQDASVLYVSTVTAPEWLLAGRLAGVRVVCHVHESMPMSRPASALLLSPLLAADLVVANSGDTQAWIRASLGERVARRTCVVHNGVREPASPAAAPSPGRPRSLVVVGRLSVIKGQDTAVRATALVRQAGHDVTLTLVGDCYPGYEAVEDGLRDLAVRERVDDVTVFTGFRDPAPIVAGADVVLVPSRVESFGLVAVEALLLGRPVVATRIGGLPEVLRDGETGLLVPVDDPRALADAVMRLLQDPQLAAALGAAGRADARARFSMTAFTAALADAVLPGPAGGLPTAA
ncbi:Glycosyltransferase Family 4 [Geodermatophilus amargosae]|uniref:Glycosyltransferase Family 4 n=1 Tax=Geodermatophilus amargosae TaxID=1296565 RepID=A0A1I7A416_9ACTN|nr:glycosyltransferase [Geodermatophilus amargosae]SFT69652.1 Glycosyltransferase Family 4 [Geodermatophilus amargosae]